MLTGVKREDSADGGEMRHGGERLVIVTVVVPAGDLSESLRNETGLDA